MNIVDQMKLFLEPNSVAIVGASRQTGPGSWNILENLLNVGFSGKLYPVNPNADQILGIKCYPSVKEIPGDVELAVIATPRSIVPQLVKECVQRGIKAITIVAQGFADGDQQGKEMQTEIVRIASKGGARILGPNTFGTANAFNNFSSAFVPLKMKRVPIGIICQTGFLFVGLPKFPLVGKGIDLGNACDIDFADGLEYFEHDPEIKVVLLHIEGLRAGRKFMEVAKRTAKKKPIIALKTGRSEEGAKAAQSHTGALTGKGEIFDAAFRQCGVIRVNDPDEFADLSKAFLRLPLMREKGVGVITWTGAAGIMATDACQRHNLRLARPSPQTLRKIQALAPEWQEMGNPADIWASTMIGGHPMDEVFGQVLGAFLADKGIDGVAMVFRVFPQMIPMLAKRNIFQAATKFEKPIVCWLYGTEADKMASVIEKTPGVAVYPTLDRAIRTLSRLNEYWEFVTRS